MYIINYIYYINISLYIVVIEVSLELPQGSVCLLYMVFTVISKYT